MSIPYKQSRICCLILCASLLAQIFLGVIVYSADTNAVSISSYDDLASWCTQCETEGTGGEAVLRDDIEIPAEASVSLGDGMTLDAGKYGVTVEGALEMNGASQIYGEGINCPVVTVAGDGYLFCDDPAIINALGAADMPGAVAVWFGGTKASLSSDLRGGSIYAFGENCIAVYAEGDVEIDSMTIEASGPSSRGLVSGGNANLCFTYIWAEGEAVNAGGAVTLDGCNIAPAVPDSIVIKRTLASTTAPVQYRFTIEMGDPVPDEAMYRYTGCFTADGYPDLYHDFTFSPGFWNADTGIPGIYDDECGLSYHLETLGIDSVIPNAFVLEIVDPYAPKNEQLTALLAWIDEKRNSGGEFFLEQDLKLDDDVALTALEDVPLKINTGAFGIVVERGTLSLDGCIEVCGQGAPYPVIDILENAKFHMDEKASLAVTGAGDLAGTALQIADGSCLANEPTKPGAFFGTIYAYGPGTVGIYSYGDIAFGHLNIDATAAPAGFCLVSEGDVILTQSRLSAGNDASTISCTGAVYFENCELFPIYGAEMILEGALLPSGGCEYDLAGTKTGFFANRGRPFSMAATTVELMLAAKGGERERHIYADLAFDTSGVDVSLPGRYNCPLVFLAKGAGTDISLPSFSVMVLDYGDGEPVQFVRIEIVERYFNDVPQPALDIYFAPNIEITPEIMGSEDGGETWFRYKGFQILLQEDDNGSQYITLPIALFADAPLKLQLLVDGRETKVLTLSLDEDGNIVHSLDVRQGEVVLVEKPAGIKPRGRNGILYVEPGTGNSGGNSGGAQSGSSGGAADDAYDDSSHQGEAPSGENQTDQTSSDNESLGNNAISSGTTIPPAPPYGGMSVFENTQQDEKQLASASEPHLPGFAVISQPDSTSEETNVLPAESDAAAQKPNPLIFVGVAFAFVALGVFGIVLRKKSRNT